MPTLEVTDVSNQSLITYFEKEKKYGYESLGMLLGHCDTVFATALVMQVHYLHF